MRNSHAQSGGVSELMHVLDMEFPEEVLIAYWGQVVVSASFIGYKVRNKA